MEVGNITLRDRLVGLLEQIFYHGRQFEQEALHQLASKATADDIDADLALLIEASHHYWMRQFDACLVVLTPWLDDTATCSASPYCILAIVMWYRALSRLNRHAEALQVVDRTRQLRAGETPQESMALSWIQGQAMLSVKRFIVAAGHLDHAHILATRNGFDVTAAIINIDRAALSSECDDPLRAIVMYEASVQTLSSAHDGLRPLSLLAKFNIATVYVRVGRDEDALQMYDEVVEESQRWKFFGYNLTARFNTAISLKNLRRLTEARTVFSECLEEAAINGDRHVQFRACMALSELAIEGNDIATAQTMAAKAVEHAEFLGVQALHLDVLAHLALLEGLRGDHVLAINTLTQAYEAALRDADVGRARKYAESLADLHSENGNFEQSFRVLQACSRLKDQINATELQRTAEEATLRLRLASDRETLQVVENEREGILRAVMPSSVAERMMAGEQRIADAIARATIMFVDIVGFTQMASETDPEELVILLEELFTTFDRICERHGCERIKTIGDSYMAICGATTPCDDHALRMCQVALEIIRADTWLPVERRQLRIGIHCGPVVAGVMRGARVSYDVWGDTVAGAARMESIAEPGRVHCSQAIVDAVGTSASVRFEQRAPLTGTSEGRIASYWAVSA